tara:strand:+ start:19520 stop:19810 length:291 start_codon:yes stop_codon:yes gene_type:complete
MDLHEFENTEHKNSVVIPLSFFDKLLKCYYGDGPRADERYAKREPESPAAEVIETGDTLKDLQLKTEFPEGYVPKGVALRKIEARNARREDKATEE